MNVYSDLCFYVVAEDSVDATNFFVDRGLLDDKESIADIRRINPDTMKVIFPLEKLPAEYHNEHKYPRKDHKGGHHNGIAITLTEAMKYHHKKPPYILAISDFLKIEHELHIYGDSI